VDDIKELLALSLAREYNWW